MHPQAQLASLYFTTTGTGCSYCDIYTFYGYTDPVHTLHSVISASAQFVVAASNREFQNPVKGSPVFLFTSVLGNFINTEQKLVSSYYFGGYQFTPALCFCCSSATAQCCTTIWDQGWRWLTESCTVQISSDQEELYYLTNIFRATT